MQNPTLWLRTLCLNNGLSVSDTQLAKLARYVELLLAWNAKINLVSRRDIDNVWQNHVLHSISPLFKIELPSEMKIVDIGTGGGLPGIPLKIMLPNIEILLIDSTQKKTKAVESIIQALELPRAKAIWGRAEELGQSRTYRGLYDFTVGRAVAPLKDIVRWSASFLGQGTSVKGRQPGGENGKRKAVAPALIALKGGNLEKEIQEAKSHSRVESIEVLDLVFKGSEHLADSDKKMVIVQF